MGKTKSESDARRYFWHGTRVSKEVYENKLRMSETAKKLNESRRQKIQIKDNIEKQFISSPTDHSTYSSIVPVNGRRFIHYDTLAQNLISAHCQNVLSLLDVYD